MRISLCACQLLFQDWEDKSFEGGGGFAKGWKRKGLEIELRNVENVNSTSHVSGLGGMGK